MRLFTAPFIFVLYLASKLSASTANASPFLNQVDIIFPYPSSEQIDLEIHAPSLVLATVSIVFRVYSRHMPTISATEPGSSLSALVRAAIVPATQPMNASVLKIGPNVDFAFSYILPHFASGRSSKRSFPSSMLP